MREKIDLYFELSNVKISENKNKKEIWNKVAKNI